MAIRHGYPHRTALHLIAGTLLALTSTAGAAEFVIHEWGTFTTRHGADGTAVEWQPLQNDGQGAIARRQLPGFVQQESRASLARTSKDTISGTVRMETPVIYAYTSARRSMAVSVQFPQGLITEWYPRARWTSRQIRWPSVQILPDGPGTPPVDVNNPGHHYYAARATDAALLRVQTKRGAQVEKLLFYRGVGTFDLPIRARRDGDTVIVDNDGSEPIGTILLVDRVLPLAIRPTPDRVERVIVGRAEILPATP